MAIAEYLLLTGATSEIDNRKYSRKEFWDALAKTTVDLKPPVTDASKRKLIMSVLIRLQLSSMILLLEREKI